MTTDSPNRRDKASSLDRLRRLEQEVLQLRRSLIIETEEIPPRPFRVLAVQVDRQEYAIEVTRIVEVLPMMAARPLPESPDWILGTFRFGSDIVPLVDLRQRLQGAPTRQHPSQRVILADCGGRLTAYAVDAVGDLLAVEDPTVSPPRSEIPQAPFLVAHLVLEGRELSLLSLHRLGSDVVLDAEADSRAPRSDE